MKKIVLLLLMTISCSACSTFYPDASKDMSGMITSTEDQLSEYHSGVSLSENDLNDEFSSFSAQEETNAESFTSTSADYQGFTQEQWQELQREKELYDSLTDIEKAAARESGGGSCSQFIHLYWEESIPMVLIEHVGADKFNTWTIEQERTGQCSDIYSFAKEFSIEHDYLVSLIKENNLAEIYDLDTLESRYMYFVKIIASEEEQAGSQDQSKEKLEFMQSGEFFDIGARLYPARNNNGIQARFRDNLLHVWGGGRTIRYDYLHNQIIESHDLDMVPLGTTHYYSCTQLNNSTYKIVLYDKDRHLVQEYTASKPSMPSIDGKFLVSVDKTITVFDSVSGNSNEFDLATLFQYAGSIWTYDFDGEQLYFSATINPFPGKEGVGYYNVTTGKSAFFEEYDFPFSGIPEYIGNGSAWFWQDGSAYGTDGSYGVLLNTKTSTATKIDISDPTCKMNNHTILSVKSQPNMMGFGKVEEFEIYDGLDYKQCHNIPVVTDTAPLYRAVQGGLQLSGDMRYICMYAAPKEAFNGGIPQSSLFLYRVS